MTNNLITGGGLVTTTLVSGSGTTPVKVAPPRTSRPYRSGVLSQQAGAVDIYPPN
jgi:hypothetical protein